jgi:hypothetical protein
MQVNHSHQRVWTAYDPETITNTDGGVAHGASIVRNLRAIGEDTLHLLPDRAVEYGIRGFHTGIFAVITTPVLVLWGLIVDAFEVLAFPLMLVKNLVDSFVHAFLWLLNTIQGKQDGKAAQVDAFQWKANSSVINQFQAKPRTPPVTRADIVPATTLSALASPHQRSSELKEGIPSARS